MISYLFSSLESGAPHWKAVGALFILLSIGFDCIWGVADILRAKRVPEEIQPRFQIGPTIASPLRPFAVTMILRGVGIYLIYRYMALSMEPFFHGCFIVYIGLNLSIGIIWLSISLVPIPFPKSPKPSITAVVFLSIGALAGIGSCTGMALEILELGPSFQDWKVATVLLGISVVILLISRIRRAPALLSDLESVERRTALEELTPAEACKKTERVLLGMTLGDVMEPYVQPVLRDLDELETTLKEILAKTVNIEEVADKLAENPTAERVADIRELVASNSNRLQDGKTEFEQVQESYRRLKRRAETIEAMAPQLSDEIAELMDEVRTAANRAITISDEAAKRVQKVEENIQKKCPFAVSDSPQQRVTHSEKDKS